MTHRFHPLSGREFEFVEHRHNWGEDRVYVRGEDGVLFSLPAGWTDAAPPDPFVVIAAGRCPFTAAGLLALAGLVDELRGQPGSDRVSGRLCRECKLDYVASISGQAHPGMLASHNLGYLPEDMRPTAARRCGSQESLRQNYPDSTQ
ncbi:MAG TPA: DUF5372 family protein [Streptosporangiaceae bacterium]|nr:DUF5372 family protein [Streptosporangiaceae bacterium]